MVNENPTHGTARLKVLATDDISVLHNKGTVNCFVLGTNYEPWAAPIRYGDFLPNYDGLKIEHNRKRLDDSDHGLFWRPLDSPGMALSFGYQGSGKGGILIPAALTYAGCMMLNDPKGELAALTAERRRQVGQKTAVCDPFGEVQRNYGDLGGWKEPPTRYNPLAGLSPEQHDFAERCATIAEALAIDKDERGTIFSSTGQSFIEGALMAECTRHPGTATLRDVRSWMNLSDLDLAAQVTDFVAKYPDSQAADRLRLFSDMTSRTNQSTRLPAKDQTKFLDNPTILRFFEPEPGEPTFTMDELTSTGITIYVVLPGIRLGAYSGFSRLLFNQALEAVQRNRNRNRELPVAFMIDEAGTAIGRLDSLEQGYGLLRGANALLWCFYQDLPQLKRDYPRSFNSFINNSVCLTVLGARDQETCEYFSTYMGNMTIRVESTGTSTGSTSGSNSTSTSSGSSTNTSYQTRPCMYPEEIRKMHPGLLLAFMPETKGNFRLCKFQYFKDSRFNGLYRPDPNYGPWTPAPTPPPMQYSQPTVMQREFYMAAGKWNRKVLYVGLAALLLAFLLHFAVFGLIAMGIAAFVAKPKPHGEPPEPQRGDWYILRGNPENSPDQEVGFIREYDVKHYMGAVPGDEARRKWRGVA